VHWRPPTGWGAGIDLRQAGAFAVDASNTLFYPGYTTLGLALTYSAEPSAGRRWRGYLTVENATDRLFASSTGLSGGVQTFNVAAPRGVRLGLQLDL
jgi:hypothetical protein